MKPFHNKNGFNLIEVIISIVILSLIASSLSLLFSLSLDTPYIENKIKANYYAQREIERLNNMSFDSIVSVPRTNYSFDNRFDYEIKVGTQQNQMVKEVYVNFYSANSNTLLSELYTEFVKVEKLKICEDFQDGNIDDNNPWSWITSPQGQWRIETFQNSLRLRYKGGGVNVYAYPNTMIPMLNYVITANFYVSTSVIPTIDKYIYIGGRSDTSGNGYFATITLKQNSTIVGITYLINNNYICSKTISDHSYNRWNNVRLEIYGSNIKLYYNNTYVCEINNAIQNSGIIYIKVDTNLNTYFDDICVEEIGWEKDFLLLRLW